MVARKKECQLITNTIVLVFILFIILAYSLPNDLWSSYPVIGRFVESISDVAPSIGKFIRLSEYPQVTSTLYALGIIFWPILSIVYLMGPQKYYIEKLAKSKKYSYWRVALVVCATIVAIYGVYFIIPGEIQSGGKYTRYLWQMYTNRIVFSAYSTLFFIGIALFTSGILLWIKEWVKELLRYS